MAVHVLPHASARPVERVAVVPPFALAVAILPAVLDLLRVVQPGLNSVLSVPSAGATALAAAFLMLAWARFPRTVWLLAAGFAALAGAAMRLAGADVAPVLTVLSIVALGLGGAFVAPVSVD